MGIAENALSFGELTFITSGEMVNMYVQHQCVEHDSDSCHDDLQK